MVAIIYDEDGKILEIIPNIWRTHRLTDTYHDFNGDESKIWLIKFVDKLIEDEE